MMITANGIRLHVQQRGAGAPALVFLHYWGGSVRTWTHVIDFLEPGFRTIAFDQRGWGQSDKPADGYALANLADDAEALIEALNLRRYILVGHSMGGKVAQLIASRRPDGLIGLALIAPSPPSPQNIPLEVRQNMVGAYLSRENVIATLDRVLAPVGLKADDLETVIADSLVGSLSAKKAWPLSASQEDIRSIIGKIDLPVIIIAGELDRVDPPEIIQKEVLPWLPHAQIYTLPGVGHLSPLEAPAEIANLLRNFALSLCEVEL